MNRIALLCFVIFLLTNVNAHNWLHTPSRSMGTASTAFPAPARIGPDPHIQVGRNQRFQLEWATGHGGSGSFSYFVLIRREDERHMRDHDNELLDDYLSKAGTNQAGSFQKYHRDSPAHPKNAGSQTSLYGSSLGGTLSGNQRHEFFFESEYQQTAYSYSSAARSNDVVKSGSVSEYPWIKAVWKYRHIAHDAFNTDFANVQIPNTLPYGDYIIHWLWKGYYDAIDVNYRSATVNNIYGVRTGDISYIRVDHCFITSVQGIISPRQPYDVVGGNVEFMKEKCTDSYQGRCAAVQVVPLNIQGPVKNSWKSEVVRYWDHEEWSPVKSRYDDLVASGQHPHIAYLVRMGEPTDTSSGYKISEDPRDPVFYSTCFFKSRGITFDGYQETGIAPIEWRYDDYCISCQDQANFNAHQDHVPEWVVNTNRVCTNCDLHPASPEPLPSPEALITDTRCDGAFPGFRHNSNREMCSDGDTCHIDLLGIIGREGNVNLEQCVGLAKRHPNCGDYIVMKGGKCSCLKSRSCCKCHMIRDKNNSPYNTLYIGNNGDSPDPNCNRGVQCGPSMCCSATCGTTTTDPVRNYEEGFCCSDPVASEFNTERTCDKYGPPCLM